MDFKIVQKFPFKVIGFQNFFDYETAYTEIPKFWNETCEKYAYSVYAGNAPANPYEQAFVDNCIGEYGVCIDDIGGGKFRYLIAGKYTGGAVPEGMVVCEFPRNEWAVSFASCASTSFCDNIVAIAYTSVVFVCCGDYIIPLFEAICYFYVHFQAVFAFKAEISITFLAVSHVGSSSE